MVKPVANGEVTPEPAHVPRDRLTALTNALNVVRLAAGDDPRVSAALDVAARQVKALNDGMRN